MRKAKLKVWKFFWVWTSLVLVISLVMGLVPARPVTAQNFPQVVSVNGGNNNSDLTSHTVNLPGSIVAGNLLLVFFSADQNPIITFPAGWTQLFNTARTDGGTTYVRFGCWYRIADGTEGATITVTTSNAQRSAHTSYQISNFTGVPVAATATGNSTTPNPPNLTPSWGAAETLWFAACGYDQGQRTVTAYPTNYTNGRYDRSNDANGCGVGTARREFNAASQNPGTFTISASQRWVAATVAIQPIALPTVTTTTASPVGDTTATLNGNITSTGGVNCDYRGFVWGTTSIATNPGNVAPGSAGYDSNWTESGSFGIGAFSHPISSLITGTPYYFRACAHNSVGWSYGGELSFTPGACSSVRTQLALIIDGSTSITQSDPNNFINMLNGLADAIENASEDCFLHDGSVELTVVQIGLPTGSDPGGIGAALEVGPIIITEINASSVATSVRNITQRTGYTPLACALYLATDTLYNSSCFSTSHKQVINLVTDGIPTRCCNDLNNPYNSIGCDGCLTTGCAEAMASTVAARNYAISTLGMTADQDEIDAEFIGTEGTASDWLRDSVVWPQPGSYVVSPPMYPPAGWVQVIVDGTAYAQAICAKLTHVICVDPDCTITPTPSSVCANSVGNTASVTAVTGATYVWTISNGIITGGDGTSSITYSAGLSGDVTLGITITKSVEDGGCSCTGSINVPITMPTAAFSAVPLSGSAPLTVQFTDASTGATSWAWDFDSSGSIDSYDQNPSYQYNSAGIYTVTLIVTNSYGCSDDEIKPNYITVNPPPVAPTINSIEIYDTQDCLGPPVISMNPLTTYYAKISIETNGEQLNQLQTVRVTLFYNSSGSDNMTAPVTGDTQTCAILTCTVGSPPTWAIDSGSPTTWQILPGSCSQPDLNSTTGAWIFAFVPGKVATENTGAADWDAQGKATNQSSLSGELYTRNKDMNWYGEITVNTASVDWGEVPLGLRFEDTPNPESVSIKYIANGDYYEDIRSEDWTSGGETVTLSTGDPPANPGEFALMADDSSTLSSAIAVSIIYNHINDSRGLTTEDGVTISDNSLWLSLSTSGILPGIYSGNIHYQIAER